MRMSATFIKGRTMREYFNVSLEMAVILGRISKTFPEMTTSFTGCSVPFVMMWAPLQDPEKSPEIWSDVPLNREMSSPFVVSSRSVWRGLDLFSMTKCVMPMAGISLKVPVAFPVDETPSLLAAGKIQ